MKSTLLNPCTGCLRKGTMKTNKQLEKDIYEELCNIGVKLTILYPDYDINISTDEREYDGNRFIIEYRKSEPICMGKINNGQFITRNARISDRFGRLMEHSCTSPDGYDFHCYEFSGNLAVASGSDEDPTAIVKYCPFCGYHLEEKPTKDD